MLLQLWHYYLYAGTVTIYYILLLQLYNLVKIVELFIPEHLAVREDAYTITVAATSLYAMVMSATIGVVPEY